MTFPSLVQNGQLSWRRREITRLRRKEVVLSLNSESCWQIWCVSAQHEERTEQIYLCFCLLLLLSINSLLHTKGFQTGMTSQESDWFFQGSRGYLGNVKGKSWLVMESGGNKRDLRSGLMHTALCLVRLWGREVWGVHACAHVCVCVCPPLFLGNGLTNNVRSFLGMIRCL